MGQLVSTEFAVELLIMTLDHANLLDSSSYRLLSIYIF